MHPFFCTRVGAVDERLVQLQATALLKVPRKALHDAEPCPVLTPLLQTTMDRLVGRVTTGQVVPGRARPKHPQNGVHDVPRIAPGTTTPISSPTWLRQQRFDDSPLFLREVHLRRRSEPRSLVDPPRPAFTIYETRSSGSAL